MIIRIYFSDNDYRMTIGFSLESVIIPYLQAKNNDAYKIFHDREMLYALRKSTFLKQIKEDLVKIIWASDMLTDLSLGRASRLDLATFFYISTLLKVTIEEYQPALGEFNESYLIKKYPDYGWNAEDLFIDLETGKSVII